MDRVEILITRLSISIFFHLLNLIVLNWVRLPLSQWSSLKLRVVTRNVIRIIVRLLITNTMLMMTNRCLMQRLILCHHRCLLMNRILMVYRFMYRRGIEVTRRVNTIVEGVEDIVGTLHDEVTIERTDAVFSFWFQEATRTLHHMPTLTYFRKREIGSMSRSSMLTNSII